MLAGQGSSYTGSTILAVVAGWLSCPSGGLAPCLVIALAADLPQGCLSVCIQLALLLAGLLRLCYVTLLASKFAPNLRQLG